jgi:hypothetical protein
MKRAGSYRSGQTGQTVNLMAYAFAGSNPALPILIDFGFGIAEFRLEKKAANGRQRSTAIRNPQLEIELRV